MELSGFITRRNAITLVAEFDELFRGQGDTTASRSEPGNGLKACVSGTELSEIAEEIHTIAGFVIAHPVRRKRGAS